MVELDDKKIKHLNFTEMSFRENLINAFLEDKHSIIQVDDNYYITYDSFLNYIINGNLVMKTKEEAYYYQKHLLKSENNEWQDTMIDVNRWKYLYSNNDKIIKYIRSKNPKNVYIIGELSQELYNYINVYGNSFITTILPNSYESIVEFSSLNDAILIDTNGLDIKVKKEILKDSVGYANPSSQIIDINELCSEAEIYYFVNEVLNNQNYDITIFEFPESNQFENLTEEEKSRIKLNKNYIYYLTEIDNNPEIKALIKKVMGDLFDEEYVKQTNLSPGTILKNGICRLGDSDNEFCRSINGKRYTTDKQYDYAFDINIFGACMVYGALVDDKHTISSYLQRILNLHDKDYSVNNYGLRAMDLAEQIRISDSINTKLGDKLIFVISSSEKEQLLKYGYDRIISLLPVFNNSDLHDYFIDKPTHCNHVANSHIATYMYKQIKNNLLNRNPDNKKLATPIRKETKRNIFNNNAFLDEYLTMLKQLDIPNGPNGAILMNCNPFTYGHYKLIDYASKMVEKLFVIVVQEDKSMFKFDDRFEMVVNGCKDFSNVTVIPSGKIFGSSMIFPEYFNRSGKTDITIDLTLDREIFTDYIATTLNITKRFVGEEKTDAITATYNRELKNNLPLYGIEVIEIPRFVNVEDKPISAKKVREAMDKGDWEEISKLVPPTTIEVLQKYMGTKDFKQSKTLLKK